MQPSRWSSLPSPPKRLAEIMKSKGFPPTRPQLFRNIRMMSKTIDPLQPQDFSDTLLAFEGDGASYQRAFEAISGEVPFSNILLVSTFPRGGTQILQPMQSSEGPVKLYGRDIFRDDGPTWQAIVRNEAITGNDCAAHASLESSDFFRQWMEPQGFRHVAAAPVSGPIFKGYPGALHLYRNADQPAFKPEEVRRLKTLATKLADAITSNRDARSHRTCGELPVWDQQGCCRQFIFDSRGQQVSLYDARTPLDDRLKSGMKQLIGNWLSKPEAAPRGSASRCPTVTVKSGRSAPHFSRALRRWGTGRTFSCVSNRRLVNGKRCGRAISRRTRRSPD